MTSDEIRGNVSCEHNDTITHIELRFDFNVRTKPFREALNGRSVMDVPLGELLNILDRTSKKGKS